MRKGELVSLTWNDVNFDTNLITVRASVSKSKKSRRIPISSSLRTILLNQKPKTVGTGFVFVAGTGKPYSQKWSNAVKRSFSMACKRANIKGLRFHDLRHTAATRMAESGANIVAVKEILGHADIKTTMKYFHPGDSLTEAVEKLANFTKSRSNNRSNEGIVK
jgi:integrase